MLEEGSGSSDGCPTTAGMLSENAVRGDNLNDGNPVVGQQLDDPIVGRVATSTGSIVNRHPVVVTLGKIRLGTVPDA